MIKEPHSPAGMSSWRAGCGGTRTSGSGERTGETGCRKAEIALRSDSHYWAADVLAACGASVHLAHPLGNNWGNRRVKNDERDAADLIDMLRLGRLAEAYIAPPGLRELRELVRHRAKLVAIRSGLKAQVQAILAKEGVRVPVTHLFGVGGRSLLDEVALGDAYRLRVDSLLGLVDALDDEIEVFAARVAGILEDHPGYHAIQAIPGVGPVLAAIFVAEIGDVARFGGPPSCVRGRDSHRATVSPTPMCIAGISPNKARGWCAGRQSRPRAANAAPPPSPRSITVSPSTEAVPSAGSPRHASFSPSSTTACATDTSVAWPRRDETRPAQPDASSYFLMTPALRRRGRPLD